MGPEPGEEPGRGRALLGELGGVVRPEGRVLAWRAGTADLRRRDEEVGAGSQRPRTPGLGSLREAALRPRQVGDGMQPGSGAVGPRPLSCWRRPMASRVSVVSRELGTSGQGKAGVSL